MSKIIKLTPEQILECRRDFDVALSTMKIANGRISFTKTITCPDEKATLYFDPIAWLKMQTLIKEFDKEVAWHGVAHRGEDESKNEYYITDILVYPQQVTGATVNTDQTEYEMWLMRQDDQVFNHIRMQGHSHVYMQVSPSPTDEVHQSKILEQLEDDMFYIFLIWNKRGDKTVRIYDFKKNILFETLDVTVKVLDDGSGIDEFLSDAKRVVKDRPITTVHSNSSNKSNIPASNTKSTPADSKITQFKDSKSTTNSQFGKNGKRKGKRKKKDNPTISPNNASAVDAQITLFDEDEMFGYYDNYAW